MSEKKETDLTPPEDSKDRVGDILRKERITRRITVETIAKDLKLNVKYIKALEASEYEALPADPYVRVYLRSLAKYLTLDPEDILKKRIDSRKDKFSDADYNVYLGMKKIFEDFEEEIIEIDTSNPVKTNIDTIKLKIYSI